MHLTYMSFIFNLYKYISQWRKLKSNKKQKYKTIFSITEKELKQYKIYVYNIYNIE